MEAIYCDNSNLNIITVSIYPSKLKVRYAEHSEPLEFTNEDDLIKYLIHWNYELIGYV